MIITGSQLYWGGRMLIATGCGSQPWASLPKQPWPSGDKIDLVEGRSRIIKIDTSLSDVAAALSHVLIHAGNGEIGRLSQIMQHAMNEKD